MCREVFLNDYLPEVLVNTAEIKRLNLNLDKEINTCWRECEKNVLSSYIMSCDVLFLDRFENMLGLDCSITTERERRLRLLNTMLGDLPYTLNAINRKISVLCGEGNFSIEYDKANFLLSVRLGLMVKKTMEEVKKILIKRIPANIILEVSLYYNNHEELSVFTHGELSQYTNLELREEEL